MNRLFLPGLVVLVLLCSCHSSSRPLIDPVYADSLVMHYRPSPAAVTADSDRVFWQARMQTRPEDFVNGPKYASSLLTSFHQTGNIAYLLKADSLVQRAGQATREPDPSLSRSLAALSILTHHFSGADTFLTKAIAAEGNNFANNATAFDIRFERGDYGKAKSLLISLAKGRNYPYLFRRSKLEHYNGSLDSAISCMLEAATKSSNNAYLRQVALSNAADLCLHKGDAARAAALYKECVQLNSSDFHSIQGLGLIALLHDNNPVLAEKLFQFTKQHYQSPDVLLRLEAVAEARRDTAEAKKVARDFVNAVNDPAVRYMYSKYLIDLYTRLLNDPSTAVDLAAAEIYNRPTPQVYAWYAWSLYCNGENEKAMEVYKHHVSGQPLEGPELYYMGRMMQGMHQLYNAGAYYKAAIKNRYDLTPFQISDIKAFSS